LSGGCVREYLPHLGGDLAKRCPTLFDRAACGCRALVGAVGGVDRSDPNVIERDVELVGNDLCERRVDTLAQLDLAGQDGDRAVSFDMQPRIETLARS